MKRFENKVVIVTGGASGIGEATVRRLVSEGGKAVIADLAEERAERLARELEADGADVRAVYFSATELESCRRLVEFARDAYGGIDVLVNNVGGTDLKRDGDIASLDIGYFDEAFHLNLRSAVYLTQLVLPFLEARGGGSIVNMASIGGLTGDFRGTFYGMGKAALIALTRYTATQTGKRNIRCNAVAPGLVLTPAATDNLPEDMRKTFLRHNSLDRLGDPKDIAGIVAFLASEDAAYVTGQTVVADGGLTGHNPTVGDFRKS